MRVGGQPRARRCAATALACALALGSLAGCGGDDEAKPSTTTSAPTAVPSTSTTAAPTSTTAPLAPGAALLTGGDLGPDWLPAPGAATLDLASAMCGRFVSVRRLADVRATAFRAGDAGPIVVSGVARAVDEGAAEALVRDIAATAGCGTWTDPAGRANRVATRDVDAGDLLATGGTGTSGGGLDDVLALRHRVGTDEAEVAVDLVLLRVGPLVSVVVVTRPGRDVPTVAEASAAAAAAAGASDAAGADAASGADVGEPAAPLPDLADLLASAAARRLLSTS